MWSPPDHVPSADTLLARVNERVEGLDKQKRRLVALVRRHMLAAAHGQPKSVPNVLVIAPTGTGKSYLLSVLLEAAGVPWVHADATIFSEVGYTGRDLSQIFLDFMMPPWTDRFDKRMVPLAQRHGVVVLDEFDKLRVEKRGQVNGRDTAKTLQAELLRMLDGTVVAARKSDQAQAVPFDTTNLMWICVGAFDGLGSLVADEVGGNPDHVYQQAESHHLIGHGFMAELVGRLGTICTLPPADPMVMARILKEQIWPRYVAAAALDEVELVTTNPALVMVAQLARQNPVGARALVPLLEKILAEPWAAAVRGDRIVMDPQAVSISTAHIEHPDEDDDYDEGVAS